MTPFSKFAFRCHPVGFLLLFVAVILSAGQTMAGPDAETISLAGKWRFRLDPNKVGIQQEWHWIRLPDEIKLPGTTDEARLGLPNREKPWLLGLYRPNVYAGPAWYQRDIEIPADWQGRRVELFMERVHWETRVFLDRWEIGLQDGLAAPQHDLVCPYLTSEQAKPQDSLIAPHVHDLGFGITPGKHMLTIRVDNSLKFDLGGFVSILHEGTQTNWNGVVGKLQLRALPRVWIDSQRVFTKNDGSVTVEAHVRNDLSGPVDGTISATVVEKASGKVVGRGSARFSYGRGSTSNHWPIVTTHAVEKISLKLESAPRLWSEFSPDLYEVQSRLVVDRRPDVVSTQTTTFGFRELGIRGDRFVLNGRPIFLRGTLECGIFPLTGYPPTDVPAWRRIFRIIKSYGLNFMRFHSWCPPDAAFAAADLEGVYLQVEGPEADIDIDRRAPIGRFMEQELLRIVRTYGNHPSFCLMTLGNEETGVGDTLEHWVEMLIREDPRHLYSSASSGPAMTANRQFTENSNARGVRGPRTDADFRNAVSQQDRPLAGRENRPFIGHEIGSWTFFPSFDEITKYKGVLQAKNFELVRDDLAKKHLLDLAPQFVQAAGRHNVLLYKEEIEVLLRTPNYAGFSLLDLHDYPGCGTALVGLLDPFWDSKGFITPQQHARYCGSSVPLLRLKKRIFSSDEALTAAAEIAHFGAKDLAAAVPEWSIRDEKGTVVAAGALSARDVPTGKLVPLGEIEASLANAAAPGKFTIHLSLKGTIAANEWEIWIYPPKANIVPPKGLVVSKAWSGEVKSTLARGGRVLLFAASNRSHSLPGGFLPVHWSPVWFCYAQVPNTMGILCDPKHPALADFPTEFYGNWQWYELLDHSRSIILDDTPAEFRPFVQVIDNFGRNHKLGVIFEARVGAGRLLVCSIDLPGLAEWKQPAARQLLASLQRYAGSEAFHPVSELPVATLDKLFSP